MEAIVLFIASAVGNAVLGHYVTEGLKNVDSTLGTLFEDEADPKDIETYVRENDLEQQVEEFAAETVKSSFVIPDVSEGAPTMSVRAALFGEILKVGFEISNARLFDVMLPGSFLGPHAFTLFQDNEHGVPTITARETVVNIERESNVVNQVYVIPITETGGPTLWEEYRSALLTFRSTSGEYFDAFEQLPMLQHRTDNCSVEQVTAGGVIFEFSALMSDEIREGLRIPQYGKWAPVQQPYDGIDKMLDGMATLLDIDRLDPSENEAIERIYDRLRRLGEGTH